MLIELAIAAFVIGIGILALLGLAHVAERAAADAEAETRAALFADEVFITLRLYSDRYAQSTNQTEWVGFWTRVAAGEALPLATEGLPVWKPMTAERPRLSVARSLRHIQAQLIDDLTGRTLAAASTLEKDLTSGLSSTGGVEAAKLVGKAVAERAVAKGISQVVFDRGGRPYHGRVQAVAEGAREAGLVF